MANTTLDLSAVWNDTLALVNQHKEAAIAIAGVFIFLPAWLMAYFVGEPLLTGEEDINQLLVIMQNFYADNILYILASSIVTIIGILTYYIMLMRDEISTIGDALKTALALFLVYFVASFLTGIMIGIGFILFIIPGIYIVGRFTTLPAVIAGEGLAIIASIKRAWALTENVGWMAFLILFIVAVVGSIIVFVLGLFFGLIFGFIGGTTEILLTTGFTSLFNAVLSIVIGTLGVAIYRHVKPQVDGDRMDTVLQERQTASIVKNED